MTLFYIILEYEHIEGVKFLFCQPRAVTFLFSFLQWIYIINNIVTLTKKLQLKLKLISQRCICLLALPLRHSLTSLCDTWLQLANEQLNTEQRVLY